MTVYRIVRKQRSAELSGRGAFLHGGRWNSRGVEVIYTAQSRALCLLEALAHLSRQELPSDYVMMSIELPESRYLHLHSNDLPDDWRSRTNFRSTRTIGDQFLDQNDSLALEVPSVVIPEEYNVLINPNHSDFKKVKFKIEPFHIDPRFVE